MSETDNNIKSYFDTRATVRRYSDKPVPHELINSLLASAAHAPTTGNMQLYSVIVTTSTEGKEALSPAHFNQPQVKNAPVVLTFCADFHRFCRWCEERDAKAGYDNFQSFVTAMIDTVILAQQFVTLAELSGLGTCYLGTTTYNAPQIAEALSLPDMVIPVTTVTVGWPEEKGEDCGRIPPAAFIHQETYSGYDAQRINDIYSEKEARQDSAKFVAENNKQTLAQVFTDVRYTREANTYFSQIYRDFINRHGFPFPDVEQ